MSEEYEIEVIPVVVAAEPIELYKILKIENLVTSGSEAKQLIAEGYVFVNGEVETRKRKKIMFGDIVGFNGEAFQVLSEADMQEYIDSGEYEMVSEPDVEYAEIDEQEYMTEEQDVVESDAFVNVNNSAANGTEVYENEEPEVMAEEVSVERFEQIDEVQVEVKSPEKSKPKVPKQRAEPAFVSADKPKKKKQDKQTKAANKKKKGRAAPFSF